MSSMSVMEASTLRTKAKAAKLAAMAAAKDAAVLFRYVRPPLASLDPIGKPADMTRLLCLATDMIGASKCQKLVDGYATSDTVFLEFPRPFRIRVDPTFSPQQVCVDLVRYCENPQLNLRFDHEFPNVAGYVDHSVKYPHVDVRIIEMHRLTGCASTFNVVAMSDASVDQQVSLLRFSETWGTWDITNPSKVLTREHIQHPPPESVLSHPGFVELMATLEHFSDGKWTFTHGPTAEERYKMWSPKKELRLIAVYDNDPMIDSESETIRRDISRWRTIIENKDIVRKKLARHLVQNPRLFIDMKTDPVCPWKGLRLFHGTDFAELQDGVDPSASAGSSGTHIPCKLSWDEYMNEDDIVANRTAFVTPYYAKSFSYGKHVHTYELSVPGESLKMLDLRNDYVKSTHHHDELDPFKDVWELAGIPHGGRNRVEKAIDLYHLFKDSGVDGIILNADVEWIFFNAGSVLDWVAPDEPEKDEEGEWVRTFTEQILNKPKDPTWTIFERDELCAIATNMVSSVFTHGEMATVNAGNGPVERFIASITDSAVDLSLSSLPITRWTLDAEDDPYMAQFATGVKATGSSRLWNSFQLPIAEDTGLVKIKAYECEYHQLWRFIEPEFDNMWMGDVIREGSTDRRTALPYHQLIIKLRELKVTLLVHLPNGHTQLVPPIKQPDGKYDRRMYITEAVKSNSNIKLLDMPIRDVYRPAGSPAASSTTATRGADDDEQAAAAASSSKKSKTAGLAGKLCIC